MGYRAGMTDTSDNKSSPTPTSRRFFGRRKGPSLSDRKQGLMDDLLPRLSINVEEGEQLDPKAISGEEKRQVWLEVGFGKGEHLAWQARENPDILMIGCEPYLNGVAGLLTSIEEEGLDNIRIYGDDARHVIWALPDASVDRIFLIHPDPWPKRRHARRRFIGPSNLDDFARILKPGGELRVGTDHPIYREWTAIQMAQRDDFVWLASGPDDWQERPKDWPETRYETKALEGKATYFCFRRVEA